MTTVNSKAIRAMSPTLRYLIDFLSYFQNDQIKIPLSYRDKVLEVKKLFNDDPSGLASTILDYAINCALVDFKIETDNANLTKALNQWLKDVNVDLVGTVPTGIKALAKEYFRERWKGSSNLLLRTFWTEQDDLNLPTSLFFVDGEDIKVKSGSTDGIIRLGEEKYYLRASKNSSSDEEVNEKIDIPLPSQENEIIFTQKPFETWGNLSPVPYIIKNGVYKNSKFLRLLVSKGEFVVSKALEYLFILKKGTEQLTIDGSLTYDKNDLEVVGNDLKAIMADKQGGFPSYITNFDTDISEYIPDYSKAISNAIYSPIEQHILAGLGLVEIVTNIDSNRKESLLNPKPFIAEVEQGIADFKALLNDIIRVMIKKNASSHKKWMSAEIEIINSPVKSFIDDKFRTMLRSGYDRGTVSKRTWTEAGLNLNFDLEVKYRKAEKKEGLDDALFAPVIQNNGDLLTEAPSPTSKKLPDRSGPEKKNFNKSGLQVFSTSCLECGHSFDFDLTPENAAIDFISCANCKASLIIKDLELKKIK